MGLRIDVFAARTPLSNDPRRSPAKPPCDPPRRLSGSADLNTYEPAPILDRYAVTASNDGACSQGPSRCENRGLSRRSGLKLPGKEDPDVEQEG